MAIYTIIDSQVDIRHNGEDCTFNGYLEDYLGITEDLDPVLREAFTKISEKDTNVKICVGLKAEINRDAISNQIIRYKDVFKLNGKVFNLPYLVYSKREDIERALLVIPYSRYGYIYAKGFYYCVTEPGGVFVDCKNDIVAICSNQADKIVNAFEDLFTKKAGAIQRGVDREYFSSYDDLKREGLEAAELLKEEAQTELSQITDCTLSIYKYVIRWFLIKKVLYVQYMVNKDILNSVHDQNIKKQRNQAKMNADEVAFLSFSEMWHIPAAQVEEVQLEIEE
ncbi:MAG: hypothetical protein IIZ27_04450 [Solobacterium sp.]|nr:hypothetical protein [Solobacterium sp.]